MGAGRDAEQGMQEKQMIAVEKAGKKQGWGDKVEDK